MIHIPKGAKYSFKKQTYKMFFFGKETKSANIGMWNLTISKKKKKKKKNKEREKKKEIKFFQQNLRKQKQPLHNQWPVLKHLSQLQKNHGMNAFTSINFEYPSNGNRNKN